MATRKPNGASSIYQGGDGKWHGRVTMGVRDDGKPDRRHVERKTETEAIRAVRKLEKERDSGRIRKAGSSWTVATWLTYWIDHIAAPNVRANTAAGYRVAVNTHLIPGIGAHRLEKLEPEHIEKMIGRMQRNGSAAATAHQAFRTLRTALNEAKRRGHLTDNPASLAKSPRLTTKEVEPYALAEVQKILEKAATHRNSARWAIALALGLRQGEALGLKWDQLDLDRKALRVRRNRLRPKYQHGCAEPCGKKAGYCPARRQKNADTDDTKSGGGRPHTPPPPRGRPAAEWLDCPPRWWSCCGGTKRSRRRNGARPPSYGRTAAGSSPHRLAAPSIQTPTTTSGRAS